MPPKMQQLVGVWEVLRGSTNYMISQNLSNTTWLWVFVGWWSFGGFLVDFAGFGEYLGEHLNICVFPVTMNTIQLTVFGSSYPILDA